MRILLLLLLLLYHKQIRNIIQDKANAQIYMLLRVTEEKKIKILLIFFYYASYCNKVYIYIANLWPILKIFHLFLSKHYNVFVLNGCTIKQKTYII